MEDGGEVIGTSSNAPIAMEMSAILVVAFRRDANGVHKGRI